MPSHYNMGSQDYRPNFIDYTPILVCDFTTLASGAASTLFGLSHTRGSGATVQTGTSAVVSGLGTDVAGIGRALDADALGLVIEEARTNLALYAASVCDGHWAKLNGDETVATNAAASPDGTNTAGSLACAGSFRGVGDVSLTFAVATYTSMIWARAQSATQKFRHRMPLAVGVSNQWGADITLSTAWTRTAYTTSVTGGGSTNAPVVTTDAANDATSLYLWGGQIEQAAWPSELIITTAASATRPGARLWHPSLNQIMTGGRLSMRAVLQAKGATADYATSPYLWRANATNYATISNSTGAVTITLNGASYTTASGVTWAQGDVLDIRVMAGGGVANSIVKVGKNGGALTTLGTSGAPQAAIPAGLALDLLQDSTASNVFSSRVRSLKFYHPGALEVLP